MGILDAKKYIADLKKKQDDPYQWPDFLTGLPDKNASLRKALEVYDTLGRETIFFFRIVNIEPYLIKYGPEQHADIIQWGAAILKTTADKYKGFAGTFGTHDFVVACPTKDSVKFVQEAMKLFSSKTLSFYKKEDVMNGNLFSFKIGKKDVRVGLMKLIYASLSEKPDMPKDRLMKYLEHKCGEIEQND